MTIPGFATLIILMTTSTFWSSGHEPLSDWEVTRTDGDIEISYRRILVGDTLETREMRITFEVGTTPDTLVKMFRDPEVFLSWSTNVSTCTLLTVDADDWIFHKTYDLPWPVSNRDLVNRYSVRKSGGTTVLDITSESDRVTPQDKFKRIEDYEAHWHFDPVGPSTTSVDHRAIELTKPSGPRFLVDRIIESSYLKAVKMLKEKAEG